MSPISLEGTASEYGVTADDRRAAQEALDAINASSTTGALFGGAVAQLESIVNRDSPQDSDPFDGSDDEDALLKSMSTARRLRSEVSKREDVDHDLRTRVDVTSRELETEYLRKHSGYWANDDLVEQAERVRKAEGGGLAR